MIGDRYICDLCFAALVRERDRLPEVMTMADFDRIVDAYFKGENVDHRDELLEMKLRLVG